MRKLSKTFTFLNSLGDSQRNPRIAIRKFGYSASVTPTNARKTTQKKLFGHLRTNRFYLNDLCGLRLVISDVVFNRDKADRTFGRYFTG
ncbi:hypothetical protein DKJADOAI_00265 [Aeromonas salmonicida]